MRSGLSRALVAVALAAAPVTLPACGSTPAPEWQQSGNIRLDSLINSYMSGSTQRAEVDYRRLMESLSQTADPDIIIRAPLTKCAMDKALLQAAPCAAASEYLKMSVEPSNRQFARKKPEGAR